MDERVKKYKKRLDALRLSRVPHEKRMNEGITYVMPYHHSMDPETDANLWTDMRFDSTATEAAWSRSDRSGPRITAPIGK